ncbi:MAG: hypothetical protein ACYS8I_06725 [Planctomycetota bacterium]
MADEAFTQSSAAVSANSTDFIPGVQQSTERVYFTPSVLRDFHFANPSTFGGDVGFGGKRIDGFFGAVIVSTGTGSLALDATHAGAIIAVASSSTTQGILVRSTLAAGFACTLLQETTGEVVVTSSEATLRHPSNHTRLSGQYAVGTIVIRSTTDHYLFGDTVA